VATDEGQAEKADEGTGLPLFSTWPRVYAFVLGAFAVMVLLLVWLTRAYS
jgi:hypothetical protein